MDVETGKQALAVLFAVSFWVFIAAPAILGLAFGHKPDTYADAVKSGLGFTAAILIMTAVTFMVSFTLKTLGWA